jgi:hypothetical protein
LFSIALDSDFPSFLVVAFFFVPEEALNLRQTPKKPEKNDGLNRKRVAVQIR